MSWHRNYAKFCEKKSQNRRNQGFSYYFCLILEGSRFGSGSIPLTNGSGSGSGSRRSKNMWIRGIWIRIRIRIRNTAVMCILNFLGHKYSLRNYVYLRIIFRFLTNLRVITKPRNYDVITRFRNYETTLEWYQSKALPSYTIADVFQVHLKGPGALNFKNRLKRLGPKENL
jgi:hypothetical protein